MLACLECGAKWRGATASGWAHGREWRPAQRCADEAGRLYGCVVGRRARIGRSAATAVYWSERREGHR
eukprot:1278961-Prymnesium_polylepis.1